MAVKYFGHRTPVIVVTKSHMYERGQIHQSLYIVWYIKIIKYTVTSDTEHDVDMIVSDYCMPDMTGYNLLMEVKKSPKLAHLPVVIASSDNIPERIRKCLDGGAKDYILKPVKIVDVPRIMKYI
ncbi:hypothetical protein OsJ_27121 [Oryza sativa Japonica Group]|uniref:Response regulatory domain-containing protein n=1 Tax=Oryza sativa subsp. japonica TaxID=39947 RepID=B9G0M7_ORYSJ|nr:hypothetical protein OsJ_27121 [Oryza sativa Japonica Group]